METYILSTPNRIHAWSKALDFKTVITSREWLMYSDHGTSEKYIFRKDGSVVMTINGRGVGGLKWEYISQNGSLLLTDIDNCQYMFKPIFYDNAVFAFILDDTNRYLILLDQPQIQGLNLTTKRKMELYIVDRNLYNKEEKQEKEERKRVWRGNIDKLMDDYKKSEEWTKLCSHYKAKRICAYLLLIIMAALAVGTIGVMSENILTNYNLTEYNNALAFVFCACVIGAVYDILHLIIDNKKSKLQDKREEIERNHPFPG